MMTRKQAVQLIVDEIGLPWTDDGKLLTVTLKNGAPLLTFALRKCKTNGWYPWTTTEFFMPAMETICEKLKAVEGTHRE